MNNVEPNKKAHGSAPGEYDLFTGGGTGAPAPAPGTVNSRSGTGTKTPDFAIFYNIAFDTMDHVSRQMKDKTPAQQNAFWAEYFWKAHFLSKNSNGYELTPRDAEIIRQLKTKVEEIRNYHSHLWHDNSALLFSDELKKFVEQRYDEAQAQLLAEHPGAVADYERLKQEQKFKSKAGLFKTIRSGNGSKHFVTTEGRIFFLGFFLTTGQMTQFLQQRTGYKRADMPQFKIRRLLCTYYCHRDGAAITGFNTQERFIDTLPAATRRNVFKARTAFKLISYLTDYPDYWGSKTAMPIFDEDNHALRTVAQLKKFISEQKILEGLNFTLVDAPVLWADAGASVKETEDKYRTGTIEFTCNEAPGYKYQLNFDALHRLVLLQILHKSIADAPAPLGILVNSLKKQAAKRAQLYGILTKPPAERTGEEQACLHEKESQYLRGGRKLTEMGIIFFEAIERGGAERDAALLANQIRPLDAEWIPVTAGRYNQQPQTNPEPIQVYQQDFMEGTQHKFRAGNRFVFYTAKFLMDFAADGWYWGAETFTNEPEQGKGLVKSKTYLKASEMGLHNGYRLTLENDHIYLALPKDLSAAANHRKFTQFAVGPNAMRYLAVYICENGSAFDTEIRRFLEILAADLAKLETAGMFNESDGYNLLEQRFVSAYLKPETTTPERLREQVINRFKFIKAGWDHALDNSKYLSRSAKNKLVMDAYRLFDWTSAGERPDGKFLRANEYNQLSVCHYSLHLQNKPAGKLTSFNYLFNNLFKLGSRQPPIPNEIIAFLKRAGNLNELMHLVFNDRAAHFNNVLSWPMKHLRKELPALCRQLGISVPIGYLATEEQQALKQKHTTTLRVQPFSIHPMLVLKHFFNKDYTAGRKMATAVNKHGEEIQRRPTLKLFAGVRKNAHLSNVLQKHYYSQAVVDSLYPANTQQKHASALTGLLNTTHTEDILLWRMAQRYLENNEFTAAIGQMVKQQKNVQLGNLNSLSIPLPLTNGGINDPLTETLYTSVLMHQLDDMMFMTEKGRLRKAALHFKRRCGDEYELWQHELAELRLKQLDGQDLPDGTRSKPIPFQVLRNELDLVRRTGQRLAGHLLKFEENVLQRELDTKFSADKNKFHRWLKSQFDRKSGKKPGDKPHFNFDAVLALTNPPGGTGALMSKYRNVTFHNDIPTGAEGSFSWVTRESEPLTGVLGINGALHARADRTAYMPGGDKHKPENNAMDEEND